MTDISFLRTKLNPPRLSRHALVRPRVDARLREALEHRVTIIHSIIFFHFCRQTYVIVSTRCPPCWEHLVSWRARGEVMDVKHDTLAFVQEEIATRFQDKYGCALALHDIELLPEKTEGGLDDRVARARVLERLAENKLNTGKAEEAERLRLRARTPREEGPSEDVLGVRVKLRTGRLDEARAILETWAHQERGQLHPPRAHRETLLILSLVHAMQGHGEESFAAAQEALTLASQLHSPCVSAVGQMRLGHAHQVRGDFRAALRSYEEAVKLGDQIAVRRTRAEACWGMARTHGLVRDLDASRGAAAEGIEIGRSAGDFGLSRWFKRWGFDKCITWCERILARSMLGTGLSSDDERVYAERRPGESASSVRTLRRGAAEGPT